MRKYPLEGENGPRLAPGDYGKDRNGLWWVRPPKPEIHMGALTSEHKVVEHEDGTITVIGSILTEGYHGLLEHGVWKEI